jgi:hypothetical protein
MPLLKAMALVALTVFLFSVVATGGCSSSTTPTVNNSPTPVASAGSPTPKPSPTPTPTPTPTAVDFVVLGYSGVPPTTDPTYGEIDGYGQVAAKPTATPLPGVASAVITVHCNQNIQFFNVDRLLPHTASSLGAATPPVWPSWNNVNGAGTTSPLLTPISDPSFSTGALAVFSSAASTSAVYSTGPIAGVLYFGDYYNYTSSPAMRTAINILCP